MYKEKILIIKLGYSETLDGEIGMITSLGDVLRSTVLLHLYKKGNKWGQIFHNDMTPLHRYLKNVNSFLGSCNDEAKDMEKVKLLDNFQSFNALS